MQGVANGQSEGAKVRLALFLRGQYWNWENKLVIVMIVPTFYASLDSLSPQNIAKESK